jgi:hypothetical protein
MLKGWGEVVHDDGSATIRPAQDLLRCVLPMANREMHGMEMEADRQMG